MSNKAKPLPVDIIRESLELDPTSKTWLRWKKRPSHHFPTDSACRAWNGAWAGKHAGSKFRISKWKTYWAVSLCSKNLYAHRVVWLLANGADPGRFEIDHIDCDSFNNNPKNLRLATHSQNTMNRGSNCINRSGIKGVIWEEKTKRWRARIIVNQQRIHLGYFSNREDAIAARENAAAELHGEFARR
jgi:hypothetical protein